MNIEKFIDIFSGLNIAYGRFIPEDKNDAGKLQGKNQIIREPDGLPEKLWEDHLSGVASLGIIPIDENNECRWGCIDIDKYNGFDHLKLIKKIRDNNLPLIVCKSKSGGAHVFMFFTVPVKASLVQSRLKEFASFLGCAGSEIFPKQVKLLLDKGQTGNYLNLPYFDADNTERYALDDEGRPCSLEAFYSMHSTHAQPNADVEYLKFDDKFKDGPPCLNTLFNNGVPEGGRDETMTNVAVFLKKSGKTDFLIELGNINNKMCNPPLSQSDIQKIEKSVIKKEYDYACNKEPLCSNCNRRECFKRKFGKGETDLDVAPTGLEKYGSEPPLWFLSLDGVAKPLELETEDLQNQIRFQRRCMEQINLMPKIIPAPRWTEKIGAILGNTTETPVKGVSQTEQFIEYLKEWCTNKGAAQTKEEIALGKPWLNREANENRKHHFLLKDLEDFLQKKKFTAFHRNKMVRVIEQELQGVKKTIKLVKADGEVVYMRPWTIPEFVDDMEDIEVSTPDMKEKESY
mgnify:CR=1 FL=1|jgi:hypothetical protein|tara:strand:+ start:771 stop:2315 length:1545 start_codon:yes stop_codon:yes gene_type:complete